MGFPCPFSQPKRSAHIDRGPGAPSTTIAQLLDPHGESVARESTNIEMSWEPDALHIEARCVTADMDRIRALAAREAPFARDAWGDDALELQIDVNHTRHEYLHFILPPNGLAITYRGYNNRQEQGWNPRFEFNTWLEPDAWAVKVTLPFDLLGRVPAEGNTWGLNLMRVNPSEAHHYVQWAPTFGDALRPELFGELCFGAAPNTLTDTITSYANRAHERSTFFQQTINHIREPDTLEALGFADWHAWEAHMAQRIGPVSLRWDGIIPGADGIPASEHRRILDEADALAEQIGHWSDTPPDPAAINIAQLEALGDAWLLNPHRRYIDAFDNALRVHNVLMRQTLATITHPDQLDYKVNPYHDSQIVNTAIAAHAYINLSRAGLSPETHATMMWTVLRGGRFASFHIKSAYAYGNHQTYESAGLATVAALFPELRESDRWAAVASRTIRLHFEREVYPDGGYYERCGYHSVALSYAMHAAATVRLNEVEHRFAELMQPKTLRTMERMHDWLLSMNAPDGSFPAFGDCGASSHLGFLQRGAAFFGRPDFAWPLRQLAADMVPNGITPRQPDVKSDSLESQFTVMRDGWDPDSFYMAVDHGPMGGQHSHIDTLGFVAFAHGQPIAVDSGIGTSYEDPRYLDWFRSLQAHNCIVIDDLETQKVAERRFWNPGTETDVLGVRSRAYEHVLDLIHDRTIFFLKGVGWLLHDRITASAASDLGNRRIDWVLHAPFALQPDGPGTLHGTDDGVGLIVLAGSPDALASPELEQHPASIPLNAVRTMRLWDAVRRRGKDFTRDVTQLTFRQKRFAGNSCEFAVLLLPYRGTCPAAQLHRTDDG
ncbi:MAG: hypothetical protein CMJ49_05290 [Planctomycetaceae bacterium]|nr:hypothetical protein [Planctomycetaceae bacterium]